MATIEQAQLQSLRGRALEQKQAAEIQLSQLTASEQQVLQQKSEIEGQQRAITNPLKRATPRSQEAQPAFTRQRREGERQYLGQVPKALSEIESFLSGSAQDKQKIKTYLADIDNYLSEIDAEIKRVGDIETVKNALGSRLGGFGLTKSQRKLYEEAYVDQRGAISNQINKLKKDYPEYNFIYNSATAQVDFAPKLEITNNNQLLAIKSDLTKYGSDSQLPYRTRGTIRDLGSVSNERYMSGLRLDFKKYEQGSRLPYQMRESFVEPLGISNEAFIPSSNNIPRIPSSINLPTNPPISTLLTNQQPSLLSNLPFINSASANIKRVVTDFAKRSEEQANSIARTKISQSQKEFQGKFYKEIFNANLKINLQAENQLQKAFDRAQREIEIIAKVPYTNQRQVDNANIRVEASILAFKNEQSQIIKTSQALADATANNIWDAAQPKLEKDTGFFSKITQRIIPEGVTYETATKILENREKQLKAQGLTDMQIRNDRVIKLYARVLPKAIQYSQWLVPIRERPIGTLKKYGSVALVSVGVAAATTAFPAALPYVTAAGVTSLVPYYAVQARRYVLGGPVTRGEIGFDLSASLVAGRIGGSIGKGLSSKSQPLQRGPVNVVANLRSAQSAKIYLENNLTKNDAASILTKWKSRITGVRVYDAKVLDPLSKKTITFRFMEVLRFRAKDSMVAAGDRLVYGYAYVKGQIVAKIFASLGEKVNAKTQITQLFGDMVTQIRLAKQGGFLRKILGGSRWEIRKTYLAEQIEPGVQIPVKKTLVPGKATYISNIRTWTNSNKIIQNTKLLIQKGVNYMLRGKSYKITGKQAEIVWKELLSTHKSYFQTKRLPFGYKIQSITVRPRGTEPFTELDFSLVKTLGKASTTIRMGIRVPKNIHLVLSLGAKASNIIMAGKDIKTFEYGQILTPKQFNQLFITFEKVKANGVKSLGKAELAFLKDIFDKLRINFNQINLERFIAKFRKVPVITYEKNIVQNVDQLIRSYATDGQSKSAYSGQGIYETSPAVSPSQFLSSARASSRSDVSGTIQQIIATESPGIAARLRPGLSRTATVTSLLVNSRLNNIQQSRNVLQQSQLLSQQTKQLQTNKTQQTSVNALSTGLVQNLVQNLVQPQIQQLQQRQQQKQITQQTQRPAPTPTPGITPTRFLIPKFGSSKRRRSAVETNRNRKRKRIGYRRKLTAAQLTFRNVARSRKLTAYLTGFESGR